jgi:hypothetical protein
MSPKPMMGFDRVPFVLPPRMAMDGAISRAPITFDGALAAPVALDAEINFDEPEEPTISMGQAFPHWNRLR